MEILKVQIWGTRGSMPAPYPDRMAFGANTSCVSAEWGDEYVIFDCGSGIKAVADHLLKRGDHIKKEVHIFISHLHLDHIMGLPFFTLIYQNDWTIHLYGSGEEERTFEEQLTSIMGPPYWPVPLNMAGAKIVWHELSNKDNEIILGNAIIHKIRSNHPDSTTLYRLDIDKISIVYGLDCELTDTFYSQYTDFVKQSNLLLFDGMYTESEIEKYKGFGHSCWEQGIKIAEDADIEQVCIMHHDWGRIDSDLELLDQKARSMSEKCVFAREGMTLYFETGGVKNEI